MAFVVSDPSGAVIVGSAGSPLSPTDAAATAVVWTNGTGVTGTPTVANQTTKRFGNLVTCSFDVAGLTAAAGNSSATFTLPLALFATNFAKSDQASGQAAGTNTTAGALVAGTIKPNVSAATCLVSLVNSTGSSQAMNGKIQCVFQYSLV